MSVNQIIKNIYKIDYSDYIEKYANEYNVDKYLIYAIIKNESNFIKDATSSKQAKGLMQIMNETGKEVSSKLDIENDLYDEEINIHIGTYYLAQLINKYDNNYIAVAAYNAGSGNVDKWIQNEVIKVDGSDVENIPFKETNNYVRKVFRDYDIYKKLYDV